MKNKTKDKNFGKVYLNETIVLLKLYFCMLTLLCVLLVKYICVAKWLLYFIYAGALYEK